MKRSKLIFLLVGLVFVLILVFIIWDFSRKTTFPGAEDDLPAKELPYLVL